MLDKTVEEAKEDLKFDTTDRLIRDLSTGNRKKVGLISTLIGDPGLLVWDEPFSNLDEESKDGLRQIIHKLSNKTVLYSEPVSFSQDLPYDRKLIIEKGELKETTLMSGT